ncbi:hypothetical protein B0H14DRAFT_2691581 [Mycena olivaceomarginata]|nr:hypothetical protein B0H14DRAFT_2691581 [Mycena olivaceomarginata]
MALRLPSLLIASRMGSAPAMPWPAGYVPLAARICSHLKYWGLSASEDAPAEHGKLWKKNRLHATTGDKRLTLPARNEVWFEDHARGAVFPADSHSLGWGRVGNVAGVEGGGGRREESCMAPGSDELSPEFSQSDELSQISAPPCLQEASSWSTTRTFDRESTADAHREGSACVPQMGEEIW